jgi:hypothetical protein
MEIEVISIRRKRRSTHFFPFSHEAVRNHEESVECGGKEGMVFFLFIPLCACHGHIKEGLELLNSPLSLGN